MSVLDNLRLRGGAGGKCSCTSIVPEASICRQIMCTPQGSYGCQPFLMCGPQLPFQSCPPIIFYISPCPTHASCSLKKTGSKASVNKRKSSKRSSRSRKGSKKPMQTSSNHSKSSQISGASSASHGSKEIINSHDYKTAPNLFDTQSTQYNSMESIPGAKPEYKSLTVEPIKDSRFEYTGEYPSSRYSAPPAFGRSSTERITYAPFTSFQGEFQYTDPGNKFDTSSPGSKSKNVPSDIPQIFISPATPITNGNVSPIKSSVQAAASPFVSPGSPVYQSSKIHGSGSHNVPAFPKQPSTDRSPQFVSLESGSISQSTPPRPASQKTAAQLSEQAAESPFTSPGPPVSHSSGIDASDVPAFPKEHSTDRSPQFVSLDSGSALSQSSSQRAKSQKTGAQSPRAATQQRSASVNERPFGDRSVDEADINAVIGLDYTPVAQLSEMDENFAAEAKAILEALKAFQKERRLECSKQSHTR